MPKSLPTVEHPDAVKAVAFMTALKPGDIIGYAVVVLCGEDDIRIVTNTTTKAFTVAMLADAVSHLALEVANDLNGVLRS